MGGEGGRSCARTRTLVFLVYQLDGNWILPGVVVVWPLQAVKAQKLLEEENSKLKYQILHLKMAVREGDAKLVVA